VTCDEKFGRDAELLDQIATLGLWYVAEVPHKVQVWQERVASTLPPFARCEPRLRCQRAVAPAPQEVQAVAVTLPPEQWQRYLVQASRQGQQVAEFASVRVSAARDELPGPEVWLVLQRNLSHRELKSFLSNAPADIPQERLVRSSGMRWPIDICLEFSRQRLGMGAYTVRSWRGWHHHMTLVILALVYGAKVNTPLE
jgi:SRSO17 transposase